MKAFLIDAKHFKPNHPNYAFDYSYHSLIEEDLGNPEEAIRLSRKAFLIFRHHNMQIKAQKEMERLKTIDPNIELFLADQAIDRSVERLEKMVEMTKRWNDDNLYKIEKHLGNFAEAKRLLEKATEIKEQQFGSNHPFLEYSYGDLADLECELGNLPEAKRLYERVINMCKEHSGLDHPDLGNYYSKLGNVEHQQGNPGLAIPLKHMAFLNFLYNENHDAAQKEREWLDEHDPTTQERVRKLMLMMGIENSAK